MSRDYGTIYPRGDYFILENKRNGVCFFECVLHSSKWNEMTEEQQTHTVELVQRESSEFFLRKRNVPQYIQELRLLQGAQGIRSFLCNLVEKYCTREGQVPEDTNLEVQKLGDYINEMYSSFNGTHLFEKYMTLNRKPFTYTDDAFLYLTTCAAQFYRDQYNDVESQEYLWIQTIQTITVFESTDFAEPTNAQLKPIRIFNGLFDVTSTIDVTNFFPSCHLIYTKHPDATDGHYATICVSSQTLEDPFWYQKLLPKPNQNQRSIRPAEEPIQVHARRQIINHPSFLMTPENRSLEFNEELQAEIEKIMNIFENDLIESPIPEYTYLQSAIPILSTSPTVHLTTGVLIDEEPDLQTRLMNSIPSQEDMNPVVLKATDYYYVSIGLSKDTNEQTLGLYSKMRRKKGDYLCLYTGDLIDTMIAKNPDYDPSNDYLYELNAKYTIDAKSPTSCYGRYSRDPAIPELANAIIVPVKGKPKLAQVIALCRINKGDEILIDSGIEYWMEDSRFQLLSSEKKAYLLSQPIFKEWYDNTRLFFTPTRQGGESSDIQGTLTEEESNLIDNSTLLGGEVPDSIIPNEYHEDSQPSLNQYEDDIFEDMNIEEAVTPYQQYSIRTEIKRTQDSRRIKGLSADAFQTKTFVHDPLTEEQIQLEFNRWKRVNKLPLEEYCYALVPGDILETSEQETFRLQQNELCRQEKAMRIRFNIHPFTTNTPIVSSIILQAPHQNIHLGDFFLHAPDPLHTSRSWIETKKHFQEENPFYTSWEDLMEDESVTVGEIVKWVCQTNDPFFRVIEQYIDYSSVAADLFDYSTQKIKHLTIASTCLQKCFYKAAYEIGTSHLFDEEVAHDDREGVKKKYGEIVEFLMHRLLIMLCFPQYPGTYLEGGNVLEKIFLNDFWVEICPYIASKTDFEFSNTQMYHLFPVIDSHFTLFMDNMFFLQSIDIPEADNIQQQRVPPSGEFITLNGVPISILKLANQNPFLFPKVKLQDYVRGRMNPVAFSSSFYTKYNMALTDVAYQKFSAKVRAHVQSAGNSAQITALYREAVPSSFLVYEPFLNQPKPPIFNTTVRRKPPKWEYFGQNIPTQLVGDPPLFAHRFYNGWINTRIKNQHIVLRNHHQPDIIKKVLVPPGYGILYNIHEVEEATNIQDEEITLYHRLLLRFHYAYSGEDLLPRTYPFSAYLFSTLRANGYFTNPNNVVLTDYIGTLTQDFYLEDFHYFWKRQMAPSNWDSKLFKAHYSSVSEGRETIELYESQTKNQKYYSQFPEDVIGYEGNTFKLLTTSKRLNIYSTRENPVYNVHFRSPLPYFGLPKLKKTPFGIKVEPSYRFQKNYQWENYLEIEEEIFPFSHTSIPILPTVDNQMESASRRPNRKKKKPLLLNMVQLNYPNPQQLQHHMFPISQFDEIENGSSYDSRKEK